MTIEEEASAGVDTFGRGACGGGARTKAGALGRGVCVGG